MPHGYGQADSLLLVMKRLAYPKCHVLLEGGHYEQPLLPPSLQQEQQAYPPSPPLSPQISPSPLTPHFSMAGASKALLLALESAQFNFASAAQRRGGGMEHCTFIHKSGKRSTKWLLAPLLNPFPWLL